MISRKNSQARVLSFFSHCSALIFSFTEKRTKVVEVVENFRECNWNIWFHGSFTYNAKWYNYQLSLWVLVIQICDRILAQCVTFPATRAFYHQLRTTCNFWLFYNSVIIWTVLRENTCFFHSVATVIGKPQKFQITKLPTEIYCLRILTKNILSLVPTFIFRKILHIKKRTHSVKNLEVFPIQILAIFSKSKK